MTLLAVSTEGSRGIFYCKYTLRTLVIAWLSMANFPFPNMKSDRTSGHEVLDNGRSSG